MPAKQAILTLLSETADSGEYLSCAQLADMAFARWGVAKAAIKTALDVRLKELFDAIDVPSSAQIRWKHATCKAYRWRGARP